MVSPIGHMFRSRSRISERIVGEPIEIRERSIRPVVQLSGWRGTGGDAAADGAGAQLQARPAGVIVLERDGREHRLPTPDSTRLMLWRMASAALLVAVASQVVVKVLR